MSKLSGSLLENLLLRPRGPPAASEPGTASATSGHRESENLMGDKSKSERDAVVELMVEYWVGTGDLFTGSVPEPLMGTPDEILEAIESVVDARWCHHTSYRLQVEELRKALMKLEFKTAIRNVQ